MFSLKKDEKIIEEAILEVKKKRHKKTIIFTSVIAIAVLAILLGVWFLGYSCADKKSQAKILELETIIDEYEKTPIVLEEITSKIVMDVLEEENVDVSELVTAEYVFTNSAKFTDTKHIAVLPASWTQKSFIQKWDGTIKAGIDIKNTKAVVKNKKIIVTLPEADIISYEIDNDSIEILDEKNNVFNRITVKDKVNFDKETAYEMKSRAVKNGLLKNAKENAEKIIENIIRNGISKLKNTQSIYDYTIEFEYIDK